MRESVARDSKGRIRSGAHTNLTPQGLERMTKFDLTGEKLESRAWPPGRSPVFLIAMPEL